MFIKTKAQQSWARFIMEHGLQLLAHQAHCPSDEGMSPRTASAMRRWLGKLEEHDVLRQWTFSVPIDDETEVYFDVFDPDTDAPLLVAGSRWYEFVEEAAQLAEKRAS